MHAPRYPSLYQINTRVWLTRLSRTLDRPATLDDIPDAELDRLAGMGFDWVWLLSVWQTGLAGQKISRSNPQWRREFEETLPDLREERHSRLGIRDQPLHGASRPRRRRRAGAPARAAPATRPAPDAGLCPQPHRHWIITGSRSTPSTTSPARSWTSSREPHNYTWVRRERGDLLLAYGRDPYFAGWPDTLQLNYGNRDLQEAMIGELVRIAGQCDGVRCDMAMLVLPEVFERTWGIAAEPFWPKATHHVRERFPDFCFMAEVYWDLEWTLQQQGFDYAYDKRLYDRLREGHARPVREHFHAGLDYQDKLARFLENHDEPRAAATFAPGKDSAAAVLTFLSPGLRFFHQGQFEGCLKRISPHLGRGPDELPNPGVQQFYERLLDVLQRPAVRQGQWQLLECVPAFDGDGSFDNFIAWTWQVPGGERLLIAVNFSAQPSQCYVRLPFPELERGQWRLTDLLGDARYERDGDELRSRGLYLNVAPWQYHVFDVSPPAP